MLRPDINRSSKFYKYSSYHKEGYSISTLSHNFVFDQYSVVWWNTSVCRIDFQTECSPTPFFTNKFLEKYVFLISVVFSQLNKGKIPCSYIFETIVRNFTLFYSPKTKTFVYQNTTINKAIQHNDAMLRWPLTVDRFPLTVDRWPMTVDGWPLTVNRWPLINLTSLTDSSATIFGHHKIVVKPPPVYNSTLFSYQPFLFLPWQSSSKQH